MHSASTAETTMIRTD